MRWAIHRVGLKPCATYSRTILILLKVDKSAKDFCRFTDVVKTNTRKATICTNHADYASPKTLKSSSAITHFSRRTPSTAELSAVPCTYLGSESSSRSAPGHYVLSVTLSRSFLFFHRLSYVCITNNLLFSARSCTFNDRRIEICMCNVLRQNIPGQAAAAHA